MTELDTGNGLIEGVPELYLGASVAVCLASGGRAGKGSARVSCHSNSRRIGWPDAARQGEGIDVDNACMHACRDESFPWNGMMA